MNKAMLKKHHFWVLSGVVPLLVLIAFVGITSGVGGDIADKQKLVDDAQKGLKSKSQVKANKQIDDLDGQKAGLLKQQTVLWKANWELQQKLFVWPPSANLKQIEAMGLPFMAPFPPGYDVVNELRNKQVYDAEFERMAAAVAPSQFAGTGWQSVLRYVNDWTVRATEYKYLWLALEDIWVQRAMTDAIKAVNEQAATFSAPTKVDVPDPTTRAPVPHYTAKSRVWEVEVWFEKRGADTIVRGKLKNISDRLQATGVGSILKLELWTEKGANASAWVYQIGGEFVRAGQTLEVKETPAHRLDKAAAGVFKVRQVLDYKTVPVRLIEKVALNYPDARHAGTPMVPHKALADPAPGTGTTDSMTPTDPTAPPGVVPPPVTPAFPSPATPGAAGAPTQVITPSGGVGGGGAVVDQVLMANAKMRYLVATEQVRRLPVVLAVVVDQSYVQDMQMALANMPLRFQITQTHLQRFRGILPVPMVTGADGIPVPAGSSGSPADAPVLKSGTVSGLGARGDFVPPPPVAPPTSPGGPPGGTISDDQLTAGLVDLTVYGTVSLYEKFTDAAATPAAK